MKRDVLYSIGKVSKICDVSQRMLRYYEKIGLIVPDQVDEQSRYRYYSINTMQQVQIIRYLVDSGFSMEEIGKILSASDMEIFQHMIEGKIDETCEKMRYYNQRMDSLKSWHEVLVEGQWILKHRQISITTKYFQNRQHFWYEQEHEPGDSDALAYLETEYFTMSKRNGHSMVDVGGAFCILYDKYKERLDNSYKRTVLLQLVNANNKSMDSVVDFGGFMVISGYHIGSLKKVSETYNRLFEWADKHSFRLRGDSVERHVVDIYSTSNEDNYVTEIMLPVLDDTEAFELVNRYKKV